MSLGVGVLGVLDIVESEEGRKGGRSTKERPNVIRCEI